VSTDKKSVWSNIISQADYVAHTMVQIVFFGVDNEWKKPVKGESRKLSYDTFKRHAHEAAYLTQSIIIEHLYLTAKEIREDESMTDKEKIDVLFGEVELLLQENTNQLSQKYGNKYKTTIDQIRETHKVKA